MKEFITKNFKTIVNIIFYGVLIYWLLIILTPSLKISDEYKIKLDSLNSNIKNFENRNLILDSQLNVLNTEILKVDSSISKIKQEKTIIKEYYHEKIISIDTFGHSKLEDFFSKRYKKH